MENEPVTREEWLEANRSQANDIKELTKLVGGMETKVDKMYEIFIEGGLLLKFIKYLVYSASALLILWGLIKTNLLNIK